MKILTKTLLSNPHAGGSYQSASMTRSFFPFSLHLLFFVCAHAYIDISDYFTGSKAAPRLHIDKPENGEVLEGT